ncbi:purine-binding chemotaxis protein [Burkholderia pseudomallei MSHR338]|uniref:chemotaxis protein CheW n=1 Tax=Burkholderia pseudomallei TaxID=28450 RepID=UPI0001A48743|nr:chemotaxis protein CheW [Burkholderia pseudomallei]ACQ98219.1 chemotaxis protein CheW [Burkholderia pseudomallei MSHR346]AIP09298.1 cheW-like domain protein [Burkholderia pseudomallei]EQA89215.1 purine-binding chemotaxis protein [Burkholderia pseudomallei MSHR338]OMW32638.1 chemotaxis protein CheW [Burkholderia pseudomallei]ONA27671.1 chemotaxis protein CheW [Burkholderia pseudomallei]
MNAILEAPHAARMSGQDAARDAQEFVTFRLGTEEYGIDILRVQEIRSYEEPTRIANAPAFIKGVINLRGVIVPIIDLRLKFALDSAEYNTSTVVIVLNVAARTVGVVVDAVSDVLELAAADRPPAPEFGAAIDTGFITDLGSIAGENGNRMLILLDIERLIAAADVGLVG